MKPAAVHSRIEPEIKAEAERVLDRLGLSPTEAIRIFYRQIVLRNGLPFEVIIPNEETIRALKGSRSVGRSGKGLRRYDSVDELFKVLRGIRGYSRPDLSGFAEIRAF